MGDARQDLANKEAEARDLENRPAREVDAATSAERNRINNEGDRLKRETDVESRARSEVNAHRPTAHEELRNDMNAERAAVERQPRDAQFEAEGDVAAEKNSAGVYRHQRTAQDLEADVRDPNARLDREVGAATPAAVTETQAEIDARRAEKDELERQVNNGVGVDVNVDTKPKK